MPAETRNPSGEEKILPANPGPREVAVGRQRGWAARSARVIGSGVIAGAADDDPATIGTCASIGAAVGFASLWTMLFTFPLMAGVQYLSAKIGQVTGMGLAGVVRKHYPRWLLYPMLIGLVLANTLNAAADLGAMAASLRLFVPVPPALLILPVGILILVLQVWAKYRFIERTFRWLTLSLLAYIGAAIVVDPPVAPVLWGTFVPAWRWDAPYLEALLAVVGTSFPAYLYFWQAELEVEEKAELGQQHWWQRRGTTGRELKLTAWDVNFGMFASNLVTYCIILTSAATLHQHGVTEVQTAEQLADALRPLAGPAASLLLTLGIVGTGLLAVPILSASSAYAIAETMGWPRGLNRRPGNAREYYALIAATTLVALALNFVGVNPIRALYWTSLLYGILAPPLLILVLLITNNRKIVGQHTNGWLANGVGGIAALAATAAAVALLIVSVRG
jgi:NRAMP (natural resistance-associated macrophage protein)-like metal ion transporter